MEEKRRLIDASGADHRPGCFTSVGRPAERLRGIAEIYRILATMIGRDIDTIEREEFGYLPIDQMIFINLGLRKGSTGQRDGVPIPESDRIERTVICGHPLRPYQKGHIAIIDLTQCSQVVGIAAPPGTCAAVSCASCSVSITNARTISGVTMAETEPSRSVTAL